jgi:TP901 family phage tail tape measure protein
MAQAGTDFGAVADDLRRAATAFAALTTSASVFGRALGTFRQFERQLVVTNAIAQGSITTYRNMEQAARTFALNTTVGATEAAGALQNLAQAGFTAEQSLAAMSGVLLLAQATFADVALASDVITSSIRAFQLEASEAGRVSNVFTAAITGSLATIDKLAFAMRQVAPVAEVANISIEETTAFLGQLFNIGLRGEQAGTALRNIIVRLIRPLGEAGDLLERAGVATRSATGDLRNLADILRDIGNSDLTDADLARIFETEALAGALAAIRAVTEQAEDGTTAYERFLGEITGTDRALELAVQNLETFDGSMRLFSNTVEDLLRQVGQELAPTIVAITDTIRDWVLAFNELDPATRQNIIQWTAYGAAIVSSLAVINALLLVLRGPLLAGMVSIGASVVTGTAAMLGFSTATAAVGAGLRVLPAILGRVAAAFGAIVRLIPAIGAAAGLAFGPAGVMLVGLAAAAAGTWALVSAFGALRERAAELERIELENLEFRIATDAGTARATALADAVLPEEGLEEIDRRTERLRRQIEVAAALMENDPLGLAGVADRAQPVAEGNIELLSNAVDQLDEEAEYYQEILERRRELRDYQERIIEAAQGQGGVGGLIDRMIANGIARDVDADIEQTLVGLSAEEVGFIRAFEQRYASSAQELDDAIDSLDFARRVEQEAIAEFLSRLATGDAELDDDYALLGDAVSRSLTENPDVIDAIARELAIREIDPSNQEAILRLVAGFTGDRQLRAVLDQIVLQQEETAASVIPNAVAELEAGAAAIRDSAERNILRVLISTSDSIEEGVAAAIDLANREFSDNLQDVGDDLRENYGETLSEFIGGTNQAIIDALGNFNFEEFGEELPPSFSELISGQALLEAVAREVDSTTTPEELQAIIAEEEARYTAILDSFVAALIRAGTLNDDQEEAIRAAAASSMEAAIAALEAGFSGTVAEVEATTQSITRRVNSPSRRGGGGQSAADLARQRLREARQIEDAFSRARDAALDAQEAFLEAAQGFTISERAELFIDLDVEQTRARFEQQIQNLNRQLEDIEIEFAGSPEQLAELRQQYSETIELIERTRDAEIAAANSFTAQMERRSDAIDLFIRDLQNLAHETEGTFSRVAAGIGIAFAEYQRDLVTLVDITSNAVTGFLDAVTTGVADFIFDNENAWENFKENMLNISREIFEGFTRAFLQQAISSLTDGGGSIFGNIFQPGSLFGGDANSETPSVGTGGLLGGLFGGGEQGGGAGAGIQQGAAQIQAGTQQVATVLQQGAAQIQAAFGQVAPQVQASGAQVSGALTTTGTTVRAQGQVAGQGVQAAGNYLSGSINAAAAKVSSSGGGGGFGLLGSLFGFANGGLVGDIQALQRFASGGRVSGPGTGTSDDILAYLSNGEFVMRSAVTRQFLPLLEAMNSGASSQDIIGMLLSGEKKGFGNIMQAVQSLANGFTPAYAGGGLVGGILGTPNISEPRLLTINPGNTASQTSISNTDARRSNSVVNVNVTYKVTGNGAPVDNMRRSMNQHAKALAAQIEKAKKNT